MAIEQGKKMDEEKANKELLSNISKVLDDGFSVIIVAFKPNRDADNKCCTLTSSFGVIKSVSIPDIMHMMDAFMETVDKGIYQQLPKEQQDTFTKVMRKKMGIIPYDDTIYG